MKSITVYTQPVSSERKSVLSRFRRSWAAGLQLAALLGLMLHPVHHTSARYVPDAYGNGQPVWEQEFDTNGQKVPDPGAADWGDDDGDQLPNWWEAYAGTDPLTPDTDGDGLTDRDELFTTSSDPLQWDSRGHGFSDSESFYGLDNENGDLDGDGLINALELANGFDMRDADSNDDGLSDYDQYYTVDNATGDLDGDGLTYLEEVAAGTLFLQADTDGDGFNDGAEVAAGSDPLDSAGNPNNLGWNVDSDGDGLSNYAEISVHFSNPNNTDTDGDGVQDGQEVLSYGCNPALADTDGDGLHDGYEMGIATDFRGGETPIEHTNPYAADSDYDGLDDDYETNASRNGGRATSPTIADSDGDRLPDGFEVIVSLTLPDDWDSDDNGVSDFEDVYASQTDTDGDGIGDSMETSIYHTNPDVADTDADGISDGTEVGLPVAAAYTTNPLVKDTDSDGLEDGFEVNTSHTNPSLVDTDGDGLSDLDGFQGTDSRDQDNDGLTNDEEMALGTDKLVSDTDSDGILDGTEVKTLQTSPLLTDTDSDGLSDQQEAISGVWVGNRNYKTNPLDGDSDDDGLSDGTEATSTLTSPTLADSDEDGLNDGEEVQIYSTNPLNAHTLSDRYPDWNMVDLDDTDGGGIPDRIESFYHMDPGTSNDDLNGDLDGDHIKNIDAFIQGWSLLANYNLLFDNDGDGMTDAWETFHGLNPNDSTDRGGDLDQDWICNLEEYTLGTDPKSSDRDSFESFFNYSVPEDALQWSPYGDSDWDGDQVPNNLELDTGTDPRLPPSDGGGGETENPTEESTEDPTEDTTAEYSEFQTEEQTEEQTEQQTEEETEDQTWDISDYYTYDQTEEEEEEENNGSPTSNYGRVEIPVSPKLAATDAAGEIRRFASSIKISDDIEEVRQAVAESLKPEYRDGWQLDPDIIAAVNQVTQDLIEKIRQNVQNFEATIPSKVDATIAELQSSIDSKAPTIVISDNWVPNEDEPGGKWNRLTTVDISTRGFENARATFKAGFETEVTAAGGLVLVEAGVKMQIKVEVEAEVKVTFSAVNPMDPNPITSEQATVGAVPKYTWDITKKAAMEAGVKLEVGVSESSSKSTDLKTGTIIRGAQQ